MKRISGVLVVAILALLLPIPAYAEHTPPPADLQIVAQGQPQEPVMATVLVRKLRLRRAPRITSSSFGSLSLGDTVKVTGRTLDAFWIEVDTKIGRGWVDRSYVTLNGRLVREIPLSFVYPPFLTVTAVPSVNVRVGPEERYPLLTNLPAFLEVDVIGYQVRPRWYLIAMPDTGPIGWVRGDTVNLDGTLATVPVVTPPALAEVTSYRVNVHSGPDELTSVIAQVKLGQLYIVTAQTSTASWWQISGSFGTGWVRADFVQIIGQTIATPVVDG